MPNTFFLFFLFQFLPCIIFLGCALFSPVSDDDLKKVKFSVPRRSKFRKSTVSFSPSYTPVSFITPPGLVAAASTFPRQYPTLGSLASQPSEADYAEALFMAQKLAKEMTSNQYLVFDANFRPVLLNSPPKGNVFYISYETVVSNPEIIKESLKRFSEGDLARDTLFLPAADLVVHLNQYVSAGTSCGVDVHTGKAACKAFFMFSFLICF